MPPIRIIISLDVTVGIVAAFIRVPLERALAHLWGYTPNEQGLGVLARGQALANLQVQHHWIQSVFRPA